MQFKLFVSYQYFIFLLNDLKIQTPALVKKYSCYSPDDMDISELNNYVNTPTVEKFSFTDPQLLQKTDQEKEEIYLKTIENLQNSVQQLTEQIDSQAIKESQQESSDELIWKSQALLDKIQQDDIEIQKEQEQQIQKQKQQDDLISSQLSRQIGVLTSQVQNYKQDYNKSTSELQNKNKQIEQLSGQVNMLSRTISNMQRSQKNDQYILRQQFIKQLNEEREQWMIKSQQYEQTIKEQQEKIIEQEQIIEQVDKQMSELQNQIQKYQQIIKQVNKLSQIE